MCNLNTSEYIRNVLGGNRFDAMTGAVEHATLGNDLQFRLKKAGKNKINLVKITMDKQKDLFNIDFYQFNRTKFILNKVSSKTDVQVSDLRKVFEQETGLATSL